VRRSVEIKGEVVGADEREAGRRAILNFGHTVAHAIEATSKFATLHGEAVANRHGLRSASRRGSGIAEAGTADRLQRLLARFALPLELPRSATVDDLTRRCNSTRKRAKGTVRFALPRAIRAHVR